MQKLFCFPLAVLFSGCFHFQFGSERQRTVKLTVRFAGFIFCLLILLFRPFQSVSVDDGMLSSEKCKLIQIFFKELNDSNM